MIPQLLLACVLLSASACSDSPKSTARPKPDDSLYARVGGIEPLRRLIDEWVLEVTSDTRIRHFFAGADVSHLKLRLVERVCLLTQGPCVYKGRQLYETHADMQLEDRHLRAFLEGLDPAMERAKIPVSESRELREAIRGLAAELAIAVGS